MDQQLKEANELLEFTAHALDYVVEILQSKDTARYEAQLVEDCQALLSHVQQSIQAAEPALAPPWASEAGGLGDEWREYARRLLTTRDLWANGKYQEVVEVWREFLTHDPPFFYAHLAERLVKHL